ncbi:MAG TPA: hypothetical protein VJW20_19515 [Candidatus Angelobacter sp.]|nr:hypothetical protein [Candidatus Angelobacter sp.]
MKTDDYKQVRAIQPLSKQKKLKKILRESNSISHVRFFPSCAQKRIARIPINRKQLQQACCFFPITRSTKHQSLLTCFFRDERHPQKVVSCGNLLTFNLLLKRKQPRISAHHIDESICGGGERWQRLLLMY